MLTHWHIHDETHAVRCPCGAYAVMCFALPSADGKLLVIGTCPSCYEAGRPPTTIATANISLADWRGFALAVGFTAKRGTP